MSEGWKPVPGYEGYYEVSTLGRVRSLERWARNRRTQEVIMRARAKHDGHMQIILRRDGAAKTFLVHRLVLLAFVDGGMPGEEVLHRDGDPSNNALYNLRWGTKSENMLDQVRHGVHRESRKRSCPSGHLYTPENTYMPPGKNHRICRECAREFDRTRRSKRKAT
jgi:hypothetical protein